MRIPLVLVLALVVSADGVAGQSGREDCTTCHGELEYLRQQAPSMAEARRLLVTHDQIVGSAHAEQGCADCHEGFGRWPHSDGATTESCASCHEVEDQSWLSGIHSTPDAEGVAAAACADCHSVHQVADTSALREGTGMLRLNAECVSCHQASELPAWDAHRDTVACSSCHAAHDLRITDDEAALVAPHNQTTTCGACHQEPADHARLDAHGTALADAPARGLAEAALLGENAPPSCTDCHGGHGTRALDDPEASVALLDQCAACHVEPTERYFGTYHGKATALGSEIVAHCSDCHGSHDIFAAEHAESTLHDANLIETCASCHEASNASFVAYDSHPDPLDRSRNAPLYYSFVFMNGLLFFVLVVFGLHTALWWVRILLDQRAARAEGGDHG